MFLCTVRPQGLYLGTVPAVFFHQASNFPSDVNGNSSPAGGANRITQFKRSGQPLRRLLQQTFLTVKQSEVGQSDGVFVVLMGFLVDICGVVKQAFCLLQMPALIRGYAVIGVEHGVARIVFPISVVSDGLVIVQKCLAVVSFQPVGLCDIVVYTGDIDSIPALHTGVQRKESLNGLSQYGSGLRVVAAHQFQQPGQPEIYSIIGEMFHPFQQMAQNS